PPAGGLPPRRFSCASEAQANPELEGARSLVARGARGVAEVRALAVVHALFRRLCKRIERRELVLGVVARREDRRVHGDDSLLVPDVEDLGVEESLDPGPHGHGPVEREIRAGDAVRAVGPGLREKVAHRAGKVRNVAQGVLVAWVRNVWPVVDRRAGLVAEA